MGDSLAYAKVVNGEYAYTPSILSFVRSSTFDIEGHAIWRLGLDVKVCCQVRKFYS